MLIFSQPLRTFVEDGAKDSLAYEQVPQIGKDVSFSIAISPFASNIRSNPSHRQAIDSDAFTPIDKSGLASPHCAIPNRPVPLQQLRQANNALSDDPKTVSRRLGFPPELYHLPPHFSHANSSSRVFLGRPTDILSPIS